MLRDSVQPSVQCRFKSRNDFLFPSFSDIAVKNPRPFRRVLCAKLLMRGDVTTSAAYNSPESKCKDLG